MGRHHTPNWSVTPFSSVFDLEDFVTTRKHCEIRALSVVSFEYPKTDIQTEVALCSAASASQGGGATMKQVKQEPQYCTY